MKHLIVALALVASASSADARRLTTARFLATALEDYRLRNHKELTQYFRQATTSTPYIDRIELRAESDFDAPRHRYQLRFYPKGWGETRYTRALTEVTNASLRLEDRATFNAALQERYDLLLDQLELETLLSLHRRLVQVHKDRITVLRRKSTAVPNFDVTTLIAAEDRLIDRRLVIIRLEDRLTSTRHKVGLISGGPRRIVFRQDDLMPIAAVAERARKARPGKELDNIYLRRTRMRIKRADARYRLDQARNRDYLSFVKLEFDSRDHDRLDQAFSLGVALKMPFINPDRYDTNRLKVRHLEEKLRLEQEQREMSERVASHASALERLLSQQKVLRDRKNRGDAEASFKRYLAMEGTDPVLLLKVKESILRGDIRLTEIESMIRRRYVALLDLLGHLARRPLRNVLSRSGEAIQ